MLKRFLLICLTVLIAGISVYAENKAYISLKEATLYILNERGVVEDKLPQKVAKGDTVYATKETIKYLHDHKGERLLRIPIEYKGNNAFIYVDNIHPIRLEATDTLEYLTDHAIKPGSFREQKIIPAMEWAMNVTTNPMQWIYLALIAIGCAIAFRFMANIKGFGIIGLTLVGVSLAVMSGAEIMYFLSYEPHAMWFLKSDIVGGWGHVILNFIILAVVCACQAGMYYEFWDRSFTIGDRLAIRFRKKDEFDDDEEDEEDRDTPFWITGAVFLPLIFGIALIVMVFFNPSETIYLCMGGVLAIATLAGAFYQFSKGRIIQGIIFPICFFAASIGLTVMVMSLGFVLLIVAIVGGLLFFALSFVLSFLIGVIKGPDKVNFVDQYGRRHTGSRYVDGTVKGDRDGKFYKIDD